jgi:hypothetical protein
VRAFSQPTMNNLRLYTLCSGFRIIRSDKVPVVAILRNNALPPSAELSIDLTGIGNPSIRVVVPPLCTALHHDVLGTDDVVEIVDFLVGHNPTLLSSRDHDGSLPVHVAVVVAFLSILFNLW